MDQIQQKALNALEPFILLSKSANSPRAAADLITQATSAPNTYVFAELLQTPNIQALQTAPEEYAPYFILLQIFSWGTWEDYNSSPNLPNLNDQQSHKLSQLTLLTLSTTPSPTTKTTTLTYPTLLNHLPISTPRALEDLVISTIYSSLLVGKLDPLHQVVDVSAVAPLRDLPPSSVHRMAAVLEEWEDRCVVVLQELEDRVREIRRNAAKERRREEGRLKDVEKVEKALEGRGGGKREGDGEEEGEGGRGGKSLRRGGAGIGGLKGFGRKLGGSM